MAKVFEHGKYRELTAEEIAKDEEYAAEAPEYVPDDAERISDLEDLVSVLSEVICSE